jgi:hypothetical protein
MENGKPTHLVQAKAECSAKLIYKAWDMHLFNNLY